MLHLQAKGKEKLFNKTNIFKDFKFLDGYSMKFMNSYYAMIKFLLGDDPWY